MGKPKGGRSVEIGRLRPYLSHPTEVAWRILPVSLKKQVGSVQRLELYKGMFGPRDPAETTEPETTETTVGETTEEVVTEASGHDTTEPETTDSYEPSDANHPVVSWTEPVAGPRQAHGKTEAAKRFMAEIEDTIERRGGESL